MIKVFYADVSALMNDDAFEAHLKNVPPFRKEKINRLKLRSDKNLSLGAWMVCDYALEKSGFRLSDAGFEYDAGGKPFLKNIPEFHISLSHSKNIAVCAVSDNNVGADIECVSDFKEGICKRFFSKKEQDYILNCESEDLKRERFFRIWVLKESYVKFTGRGIGIFRDFDIDVLSEKASVYDKSASGECFFSEFSLPGCKGAVCTVREEIPLIEKADII